MEFLKWGQKQIRQFALNLTETEIRVEEATNNDPWGPHGSEMAKIAEEAADPDKYREIMAVIARRLTDTEENWRQVYKALLLLEHLVKHGPIKVARDTQANSNVLISLQSFEFKDKNGRDQGLNVRNRSKELLTLITDSDRLAEAREKARVNRTKFCGASNDEARFLSHSQAPVLNQSFPKRVVYEEKETTTDDPFEATRKRIQELKAAEGESTGPIKVTVPQQTKKEPKKLSQVKVNPEIAATFLKQTSVVSTAPVEIKESTKSFDLMGGLDFDPSLKTNIKPKAKKQSLDLLDDLDTISAPSSDVRQSSENNDWTDFNKGILQPSLPALDLSFTEFQSYDMQLKSKPMKTMPPPQTKTDPFATLLPLSSNSGMVPIGSTNTESSISQLHLSTGMSTEPNFFTLNSTIPKMEPQQASALEPKKDYHLSSIYRNGVVNWSHPQGAPMNPNAVVAQRSVIKEDPFANLGF